MKRFIYILLILKILGCSTDHSLSADEKMWQSLAADSTNYWEYAKFIQNYPESPRFEQAINSYFAKRQKKWAGQVPILDCIGRCPRLIVEDTVLLFHLDTIHIDSLRTAVFRFIRNQNDDVFGPQQKEILMPGFNEPMQIRLGLIQIVFSEKLNLSHLQKVTSEVSYGFQDYKMLLAKEWFNEEYDDLDQEFQRRLDSLNSGRLIFWKENEKTSHNNA